MYNKIKNAVVNLIRTSKKYILISVPVLGDPNLEADKTHRIKESREWWLSMFRESGCDELSVPEHFQYREQQICLFS